MNEMMLPDDDAVEKSCPFISFVLFPHAIVVPQIHSFPVRECRGHILGHAAIVIVLLASFPLPLFTYLLFIVVCMVMVE